jgi:hypothetical protein
MAPSHGMTTEAYFNGYDFSIYLNKFSFGASRDKADASHFKSTVKKYTKGQRDDVMSAEGNYDGQKEAVDELMYAALNTPGDNVWTYFPYGSAAGSVGFSILGAPTKYEAKSELGATASVSMEVQGSGTDRVRALMSGFSVGTSGFSAVYDFGAASVNPGALILHGSTVGGSLVVKLQDSADNSTFADVVTVSLSGGTGLNPQESGSRTATTGNLRRYVRISYSGAGTILIAAVGRKSF